VAGRPVSSDQPAADPIDRPVTWIHTGGCRLRLRPSPEEAATYVESLLDGEAVVVEEPDRNGAVVRSSDAEGSTDPSTSAHPDRVFRTTPPGGRFATRYTWRVVADSDEDRSPVVELHRETTLGTVLLLLLPAVLAAAVGVVLLAGTAPTDGVPRWVAVVATGSPWTATVGIVAATVGLVAAAAVYQWRLRRPVLLVPLVAVAAIPASRVLVDDVALALLLAADGLPVQPWVVAVPLLAGGVVPFALVRSFYRPSPGGLLVEHGVASVRGRCGSLPLGICLVVTVAVAPVLFLPVFEAFVPVEPLTRVVGAWTLIVTSLLVVAVVAASLLGRSPVRRLGGVIPTLPRRLWIERFETVNARRRAELPSQPLHIAVGNVRTAAGERGITTAVPPWADGDEAVVSGRHRLLGTVYRYRYRLRQGDGPGDPTTLSTERRVPNGTRGIVAYLAFVPVVLFGAASIGSAAGSFVVVPAVAVVLPAVAVVLLAPVVQILVPRAFDPSVFPDEYRGMGGVGRIEPLAGVLVAVTVGFFGLSTTVGPLLAVAIGGATVVVALRRGDYTRTELERLWTTLPVPLVSYPLHALGLAVISLLALWLLREVTRAGYGRVGVLLAATVTVLYGVVRLQESHDDAAHERFAYRTWNESYVDRDRLRWGIVLACPLVVGGSLTALGALAVAALEAADTASTLAAVTILAAVSLPAWYFVGGFLYQTVGTTAARWLLLRRSRPVPASELPATPEEVNATIRVYETGPLGGVGFSTGRRAVICLHRETLDILGDDPEAFAALLAHEDAHASVYNDGLLSTYVPFVATALLAGQNLVYAALDFRAREFRADAHAAAVVSPDAVARAIERVDEARKRSRATSVTTDALFASLTPFVPAAPDEDDGVGLFSINFGGFTMSTAHPSVQERAGRVRDREKTGSAAAIDYSS